MVASIEASFWNRTVRVSIQKKALPFSELLVKLIEPTFSTKKKKNQIFMCAQKMKRKVKSVKMIPLPAAPHP